MSDPTTTINHEPLAGDVLVFTGFAILRSHIVEIQWLSGSIGASRCQQPDRYVIETASGAHHVVTHVGDRPVTEDDYAEAVDAWTMATKKPGT